MNPESGKYLTQRILELDPDPAIDTCGPPEHFPPMSVIFSADATINDDHMPELGTNLSDLEFLNVANTAITDLGLAALADSNTLKIITIRFGTSTQTIDSLFTIPTLRQIRMPFENNLLEMYNNLPEKLTITDCVVVTRKSDTW